MMLAPIVFWQNIPSIHQAPIISHLASWSERPIQVVTESDVPTKRMQQGWSSPDFGGAEVTIAPSRADRRAMIQAGGDEAIHIYSGFHAYPETYWTFLQTTKTSASLGVIAEPIYPKGIKASFKQLAYAWHANRWRSRLDFILITGERGIDWYRRCGFPASKLYPFGYFVDAGAGDSEAAKLYSCDDFRSVRLLFIGQLIPRKGLDILLHCLSQINRKAWSLSVVGHGSHARIYQQMSVKLGIEQHVQWLESLPNQQAKALMAHADYLVLPSRFDGWGVVVNESLMMGTPVIVSDACGASDLIEEPWRGRIYRSASRYVLREVLSNVITHGPVSTELRNHIRSWARSAIAPEAAARYLLGVITHAQQGGKRPSPPWLS